MAGGVLGNGMVFDVDLLRFGFAGVGTVGVNGKGIGVNEAGGNRLYADEDAPAMADEDNLWT